MPRVLFESRWNTARKGVEGHQVERNTAREGGSATTTSGIAVRGSQPETFAKEVCEASADTTC